VLRLRPQLLPAAQRPLGSRLPVEYPDHPAAAATLGGDHDCLLGLRENGKAIAWYPPRVQTQPGEYGCGPDVAFSLAHTPPPH